MLGRLARSVRLSRGLRSPCAGCGFGLWPVACRLEQQWILSAMGALVASEEGNRRAWHQDSLMMMLPFAELIGHQTGVNVQTRRSRAASGRSCLRGCQSCRQELLPPPSQGFPSSPLPRPARSHPSPLPSPGVTGEQWMPGRAQAVCFDREQSPAGPRGGAASRLRSDARWQRKTRGEGLPEGVREGVCSLLQKPPAGAGGAGGHPAIPELQHSPPAPRQLLLSWRLLHR